MREYKRKRPEISLDNVIDEMIEMWEEDLAGDETGNADMVESSISHLMDYRDYRDELQNKIALDKLEQFDFSTKLKGTPYLVKAIAIAILRPSAVMSNIYYIVAEAYNTNPEAVRKNIRHAIEDVWLRKGAAELAEIYPFKWNEESGRPSNSEFIHNIASIVRDMV